MMLNNQEKEVLKRILEVVDQRNEHFLFMRCVGLTIESKCFEVYTDIGVITFTLPQELFKDVKDDWFWRYYTIIDSGNDLVQVKYNIWEKL